MGFKVPRKTALLQFEGEEFEGCEIRVALDITFEASEFMGELQSSTKERKNREALTFFVENCIISWNLEDDDGRELPLAGDTFLQLPGWFGLLIMNGWKQAIEKASEVSVPLDEPSTNGSSSLEESARTAPLSSVPPASPTQSS